MSEDSELHFCSADRTRGFPSPAEDYKEVPLDLNKYLITNSSATFFMRIANDNTPGMNSGDIIIVDRAAVAKDGSMVVATVNNSLVTRLIRFKNNRYYFAEPYSTRADNIDIWGVITYVIRKL